MGEGIGRALEAIETLMMRSREEVLLVVIRNGNGMTLSAPRRCVGRRAQGGCVLSTCVCISLLFDKSLCYLRLFRAFVAAVAGCWLVDPGICTGRLSEGGSDV